jgi:hypothetical protein
VENDKLSVFKCFCGWEICMCRVNDPPSEALILLLDGAVTSEVHLPYIVSFFILHSDKFKAFPHHSTHRVINFFFHINEKSSF